MLKRLLAVTALLLAMGCGSSDEGTSSSGDASPATAPTSAEWCSKMETFIGLNRTLNKSGLGAKPPLTTDWNDALVALTVDPPAELAAPLELAFEGDRNTVKVSERSEISQGITTVDEYIRDRCDLRAEGYVERFQDYCRKLAISLQVSCHPYD